MTTKYDGHIDDHNIYIRLLDKDIERYKFLRAIYMTKQEKEDKTPVAHGEIFRRMMFDLCELKRENKDVEGNNSNNRK